MAERLAYTIPEVAELIGLHERSVDRLIASKALGHIKVGKRAVRVTRRQLDEYLREEERRAS